MITFLDWIIHKDAAALLRLLESAEYFDPAAYNPLFEEELEKLLDRISDPDARKQVMDMRGFDWGGYLIRSLRRAGFKGEDNFHSIVVRLLVSPGKLFRGWDFQRHGPLDRRFRRSVWNAIRTAAQKTKTYSRRMTLTDPATMAGQFPGRESGSDVIDQFRGLVGDRLGPLALAILDQRMRGEDAKSLVGQPDLGSPSSYQIKRESAELKRLAQQFAAQTGDEVFMNKLARALEAEAKTAAKRQRAMAARQDASWRSGKEAALAARPGE